VRQRDTHFEEKARVTVSFLQRKIREYADLQEEIDALRQEMQVSGAGENFPEALSLPSQAAIGEMK
jgi:hypothetical protein